VSEFQGRRPTLPEVTQEGKELAILLGLEGQQLLQDAAATWPKLLRQKKENGLSHFSFLHLASHAFHDPLTGRLSGLALYDRDIWLHEIWECAPLPSLVTLSACSGSQSLVYEGDEHLSLTTTCLAAGAQHVIGSLWPILDADANDLMLDFYAHLQTEKVVARALALAQRAAWQQGKKISSWGSFLCAGQP
jgi:CHAT domain-containing protein